MKKTVNQANYRPPAQGHGRNDLDKDFGKKSKKNRFSVSGVGFKEVTLKWKRYVLLVLVIALFLYAITTVVMSVFFAQELLHPPVNPVEPIKENIAFEYSSVSFKSKDDTTTLRGWIYTPCDTSNVVILVHGLASNRFPFGMDTLDIVSTYANINFNVLVFDLRNSGNANATISTFGLSEKDDVLGAISYAKTLGYKNIVLHGFSTGANTAIMAASDAAEESVGAVILDSPIVDIRRFIMFHVHQKHPDLPNFPFQYTIPLFVSLYTNNDIYNAELEKNLMEFIPRPVLLIHGDRDELVLKEDISDVYEHYLTLAVGKISLWHVPGAGHAEPFSTETDAYLQKIAGFLARLYPQAETSDTSS